MQAHLDQLDLVLGQQVAGLMALKNWLPRKVELIKSHRLDELEAFNARENEQVVRLSQAESQRQVLLGLLAHELKLPQSPTLSELIALAPDAHKLRLAERQNQLAELSAAIQTGNQTIEALLRVSLEFVHQAMDTFAELALARPKTSYGEDDFASPPASGSFLLNQTA